MFFILYLFFFTCLGEEIHSRDLNGSTATEGTKTMKLAKRPLGPQIFPGRNQAEKATQLQTQTFLTEKEEPQRGCVQELVRTVN